MIRLGETETFSARRARTPVADRPLDRIHAIPHTMSIRARLATAARGHEFVGSVEERALNEALADAIERDALAAPRPEGCWCYGRGGMGERAVLLPGTQVDMVLSAYCECSEGSSRHAADDELRRQARSFEEQRRVQSVWAAARIPDRFDNCSFETFPAATPKMHWVVDDVRGWLDGPAWAMVLRGEYGVGKTGLGICVIQQGATRRPPVVGLFVKAPDILARIRESYGKNAELTEDDVLDALRRVPLLVIDDLGIGADELNAWASTMLFQILDWRHDNQRKTLITTNLDVAALAVHLGERTMHRFEEGAKFIHVDGPNLRTNEKGA